MKHKRGDTFGCGRFDYFRIARKIAAVAFRAAYFFLLSSSISQS